MLSLHRIIISLMRFFCQAFCDSKCRFVLASAKMVASSYDNTAYCATQLSKDNIKGSLLDKKYHVVLDEAYPCTNQEMSPYKGQKLTREQDVFKFFLSKNRQVIERAFCILIQRWGVFWRPMRVGMKNRNTIVNCMCMKAS